MTTTEMNNRIQTISCDTLAKAKRLVAEGYGAQGIKHETGLTVSQINAVFELTSRGQQ
jgi:hypothetical protein